MASDDDTRVLRGACVLPMDLYWVVTDIHSTAPFSVHCGLDGDLELLYNSCVDGLYMRTPIFPYLAISTKVIVKTDSMDTITTLTYMPYCPLPLPPTTGFPTHTCHILAGRHMHMYSVIYNST